MVLSSRSMTQARVHFTPFRSAQQANRAVLLAEHAKLPAMSNPANLDLARLSFDEFVQFFFDHAESEQFWYADSRYALADISISSSLLVEHLTTLFLNFAGATSKYSPAQISHGIWAMFSPSFSLLDILWDSAIPLEK